MTLLKKILENLSTASSEGKITLGEAIYHPYKLIYGDLRKLGSRNGFYKSLGRAAEKGYVSKREIKGETYVALTNLGKEKLEKLSQRPNFEISTENKEWDGKYRIVLFDIPEKHRFARDLFRNKLKQLGFYGWQKSVWIGKGDIAKEMREFIKEAKLQDYVLVVETQDLGNDKLEYLLSNV